MKTPSKMIGRVFDSTYAFVMLETVSALFASCNLQCSSAWVMLYLKSKLVQIILFANELCPHQKRIARSNEMMPSSTRMHVDHIGYQMLCVYCYIDAHSEMTIVRCNNISSYVYFKVVILVLYLIFVLTSQPEKIKCRLPPQKKVIRPDFEL
jgi:hypothetical protein